MRKIFSIFLSFGFSFGFLLLTLQILRADAPPPSPQFDLGLTKRDTFLPAESNPPVNLQQLGNGRLPHPPDIAIPEFITVAGWRTPGLVPVNAAASLHVDIAVNPDPDDRSKPSRWTPSESMCLWRGPKVGSSFVARCVWTTIRSWFSHCSRDLLRRASGVRRQSTVTHLITSMSVASRSSSRSACAERFLPAWG
jgi:hypothetical protein